MQSRTIDNLGYEASEQYARNQKLLEGQEGLTKEAREIFARTTVESSKPISSSANACITEVQGIETWADFPMPATGDVPRRFFTYELLPSLGDPEKLEILHKKLSEQEEHDRKEEREPSSEGKEEIVLQQEQKKKEKQIIINLLSCLLQLGKCMIYVHAKRSQYHKG